LNVYITSSGSGSLPTALGLSLTSLENALRRTLNIFNEEYGSAIRLTYAGTKTSDAFVPGAIILRGNPTNCHPEENRGAAVSRSYSNGIVNAVGITYFRLSRGLNCAPFTWGVQENPGNGNIIDFVAITIHELGHGVFDVDHPDDPAEIASGNCEDFGQLSLMRRALPGSGPRGRVPKEWDMEIFQQRYPKRGQSSNFLKKYRLGPSSWQAASFANGQGAADILFRPGSLPQNVPEINLVWGRSAAVIALTGGAGVPATGRYQFGAVHNLQEHHQATPMGRTPAIARKPGTSELLLAYQVRSTFLETPYTSGSDIGIICYRRSTDSGTTFGAEVCESNSALFQAHRGGLSTTYDPASNSFLIGFIGGTQSDDENLNAIHIRNIPSLTGTAAPPEITRFNLAPKSFGSWHAPSIACTGVGSDGCRVVYESPDNLGCIRWFSGGINMSTGQFTTGTLVEVNQCLSAKAFDAPSISYNAPLNLFVLAVTENSTSARAYAATPPGMFVDDGLLYSSGGVSFISTVVLAVRNGGTQAWFVKYR
jgi:hypothetical protein